MDLNEICITGNRHPWELSRSECVFTNIEKLNVKTFADIGSGDMFFTKKLLSKNALRIFAVDTGYHAGYLNTKGEIICLNSIEHLQNNSIDCLIMMDVLEHIEDDNQFLHEVLEKLTNNSVVLITVPAFQFLFSAHDIFLKHFRRYNRKNLVNLLKNNGLEIAKCHYFYTSLFFACLFAKRLKLNKTGKSQTESWKYSQNSIITRIIKTVLNIDYKINGILNSIGLHPPGLSIIALCNYTRLKPS